MHRRLVRTPIVVSVLASVACAGAAGRPAGDSTYILPAPVRPRLPDQGPAVAATVVDTASTEQAALVRLEREARAIARTTGCSSASACRTAPVGAKACGGPRSYIVYCAASTDTIALMRKLRELERAEKAYNDKAGMMSTCEMRLPPTATLVSGVCREQPAGP